MPSQFELLNAKLDYLQDAWERPGVRMDLLQKELKETIGDIGYSRHEGEITEREWSILAYKAFDLFWVSF